MNIVIRADASVTLGSGHIMRCLTLAEMLVLNGCKVSFICRNHQGNMIDWIRKVKNINVYTLPVNTDRHPEENVRWIGDEITTDANQTGSILAGEEKNTDWLIVDHYSLDKNWELQLRPLVKKIMVIDDLADRPHYCDLLLDQNLYENLERRYDNLVPEYCKKLLGPKYALLRPEFIEELKLLRERDGNVKRIFIFFGGSDPTNETLKALKSVQLLDRPDISVDLIVGGNNPNLKQIKHYCTGIPNVNFYCQVNNMARLMANADLAIGAGGSTTWERCFLKLPSIVLVIAENQLETTAAVAAAGGVWNLGWSCNVSAEILVENINRAISNSFELKNMGENAFRLMGNGVYNDKSVIKEILGEKTCL